jgi:hypothetical protein
MSAQTSTTIRGARVERYENLLAERERIGCSVVDSVCHGDADAVTMFERVVDLDAVLSRFRRYSHDYLLIAVAEDARWHVPPGRPENDLVLPCSGCLRAELALSSDIPLLPQTRRTA